MDEMDDFFAMDTLASAVASVSVSERTTSSTENSDVATSLERRPREWTVEETKLVGPCLTLIRVSEFFSWFKMHVFNQNPYTTGVLLLQLSADITEEVSRLIVSRGSVKEEQFVLELDSSAAAVQRLSPL